MDTENMLDQLMSNFKQNWRGFCQNVELAAGRELSPGDCPKVMALLRQSMGHVATELVGGYVESCDCAAPSIEVEGAAAPFKDMVPKEFHVGFGVASIRRRVYWREDGKGGFVPLDAMFNVSGEYFFPEVREGILFAVGSTPVADVVENMAKFSLCPPSATAVRRLVGDNGEKAEAARAKLAEASSLSFRVPGDVHAMVVSMDGATVPVRKPAGDGRDYKVEFKVAMCGTVGLYGEAKPDAKGVLRMERSASMGFARMPEEKYPTFKLALDAEAARVSAALPVGTPKILLMDGAIHQWAHVEGNPVYDGYFHLIDFFHAGEHLHAAAEALFGPGMAAGREWEEKWKGKLLGEENQALGVCRSIRYHLMTKRLTKADKEEAERQATYFHNNHKRMNYAWFRAKGLPIGSGPIEACCKSLVKTRLCGSGMSWTPDGGQAVLTLRSYRKAGDWDRMWNAYLQIRKEATPAWKVAA
jgi:hypothetical protein